MRLVRFNDRCEVLRNTGVYDEYGNPEQEKVYEGGCNYQEGGVSSTGIIVRKPTVYLPVNDVLIYINDIVRITTETGRGIESSAELVRDVRFTGMNVRMTKIELKQGIGNDVRRSVDDSDDGGAGGGDGEGGVDGAPDEGDAGESETE